MINFDEYLSGTQKYYYSWKECWGMWNYGYTLEPGDEFLPKGLYMRLKPLDDTLSAKGIPAWCQAASDELKELFAHYIFPIMSNEKVYFFASDIEYSLANSQAWINGLGKAALSRMVAFLQKAFTTKDKYEKLIKLQQANINKLTDDLVTSTTYSYTGSSTDSGTNSNTRKTNDTPQSFGNYGTSGYTSEIINEDGTVSSTGSNTGSSTTSTSAPIGDIAEKLAIAEKAMRDYYEAWANEICNPFKIIV